MTDASSILVSDGADRLRSVLHAQPAAIEKPIALPDLSHRGYRGSAIAACSELDAFAVFFRLDPAALRQDVRAAAAFAENVLAIRRENRKDAATGKRILTEMLPRAEYMLRQIARLDAADVIRKTTARDGAAADESRAAAMIERAGLLIADFRAVLRDRDYVRLPAGGGSDQDRLCAVLIERLSRIWTRYTNQPHPGGRAGPFVSFVAAVWTDLELPEFKTRAGEHQPLVDALGSRIEKFHRRTIAPKINCDSAVTDRARIKHHLRHDSGGRDGAIRQDHDRES
jgi:hypothetical protein